MKIKLFNCKIYISFPLIAILALLTVIDKSYISVLGFLATVLHEIGHILAMKIKGCKVKEIQLNLFSFNIVDQSRNEKNFFEDIFVLLSGSFFNFLIVLVFFIIFIFFKKIYFFYFCLENLLIGLINLLPIMSLDGGQILYIFLILKLNEKLAYYVLNVVSVILLLPISIFGFFVLINSKYNFSLLGICIYLIILILLKKNEYI